MNRHPSVDQVTEWLLGSSEKSVSHHLEACDVCRVEAESLRTALSAFRDSIHAMAQRDERFWKGQQLAITQRLTSKRWLQSPYWSWAAVSLMVMIAAALLIRTPKFPHQSTVEDQDEILLQEVQGDIGLEFPEALAPAVLIAQERNKILTRKTNPQSESASKERSSMK